MSVGGYVSKVAARARGGMVFSLALSSMLCLMSCQDSNMRTSIHSPPVPDETPASVAGTAAGTREQIKRQPPVMVEPDTNAPVIRVAVLKDAKSLRIAAGSSDAVVFNGAGQEVMRVPANSELQFDAASSVASITIAQAGPVNVSAGRGPASDSLLRIECERAEGAGGATLKLNGQDVAPRITLTRPSPAARGITAIARLDLEEYLFGVLGGEVPFERWHPEALKAQAIASRSYAYFQMKNNAEQPYDVESTVMSQVFKAGYRSNPILAQAVNSTRGQILTFNGAPFCAYFHSTCGGHTENGGAVFPDQPQARMLRGVNCPYCTASPNYHWRWLIGKDVLTEKLRAVAPNPPMGQVRSVEFIDTNGLAIGPQSGTLRRVATVRIKHQYGAFDLSGNAFRLAVGATGFEIDAVLSGHGRQRRDRCLRRRLRPRSWNVSIRFARHGAGRTTVYEHSRHRTIRAHR